MLATASESVVSLQVFSTVDPCLSVTWTGKDGDHVKSGTKFGTVKGSARSVLVAERVALNFLQRMSGIATATAAMTDRMQVRPSCSFALFAYTDVASFCLPLSLMVSLCAWPPAMHNRYGHDIDATCCPAVCQRSNAVQSRQQAQLSHFWSLKLGGLRPPSMHMGSCCVLLLLWELRILCNIQPWTARAVWYSTHTLSHDFHDERHLLSSRGPFGFTMPTLWQLSSTVSIRFISATEVNVSVTFECGPVSLGMFL